MKRNAQAALLALTAFAVLPAKSTPSTSLVLASLPGGIDGDTPRSNAYPVRLDGIGAEEIGLLGKPDDLPGLVAASFAPDAIRGDGHQDEARRGFAAEAHDGGRADPPSSEVLPQRSEPLGTTDGATPVIAVHAALSSATPMNERNASATATTPMTSPAIAALRENAPRSRLTYIGLIKPEHIVREQRCLAEAVYFEARSEPEEGRAAVAQVVLNRVKGGVYPDSVCGVVYQNRHRKLACQFTFACEGKALRVKEAVAWETAVRIARDVYEGRIYLADVGAATHYHANYVQPTWAKKLKKMDVIGRHIFYS
jgi:spore germination cell wall hydrolase CwlJ-like protein